MACFLVDDEDEICALCLPISFAVFAFCTLPSLFLNFNYFPTSHVIAVFFLVFFILFQKVNRKLSPIILLRTRLKSFFNYFKMNSSLFWAYLLILVHIFSHQALVPFYGLGGVPGDWFGHYRLTHEFLSHSVNEFPMRLPLYQLLQDFFLSQINHGAILGRDFYLFQIVQSVVGFSIFPVVNLLFERLFYKKFKLAILMVSALVWSIFVMVLSTWPKMLASTYALLAFYFYLNVKNNNPSRKDIWFCGLFSGLSILSHWLGVIYFVSILIDFVWIDIQKSSIRKQAKILAKFKLVWIALLVLFPVYVWGFIEFGIWQTLASNMSIVQKPEYSLAKSLFTRIVNTLTTLFLPLSILIGIFRELPKHGFTQLGWISLISRGFSWHYGSIMGNLTLTITIF